MQKKPETRESLPVHPHRQNAQPHVLRIDGLVGCSLELTVADLEQLPQRGIAGDFTCLEGWTVPQVKWRGVAMETVLARAQPDPQAQWIQASAGEFSVPIPMQQAKQALLALRLGEDCLPVEHGGPLRFVVPDGDCFTSIKWLDHLEVRREPGANTGKSIALGRLRSSTTP
jgi:DMSO/TMAO reductase YedYZ molybdopterin-dependent catalytic subunit